MAYVVEWNPLLDSEDVKRTLARLHVTFMTLGFMSITQVLKVVITNNGMAEVYAMNGQIYLYQPSEKYLDRLEQVGVERM